MVFRNHGIVPSSVRGNRRESDLLSFFRHYGGQVARSSELLLASPFPMGEKAKRFDREVFVFVGHLP